MSVIVMSGNSDEVNTGEIASSNHCMMSASHMSNVLCSDSWITHLEREATLVPITRNQDSILEVIAIPISLNVSFPSRDQ